MLPKLSNPSTLLRNVFVYHNYPLVGIAANTSDLLKQDGNSVNSLAQEDYF